MTETIFICQSCGMPIKENSMKGTNHDGSLNNDYCVFCFKEGEFTFDGSFEEFVEKQVKIAMEKMNMSEEEARSMASSILPTLKRWENV